MRRGYNADWITDGSIFVGITLGADFCAEHEWGIKRIQEQFDMKLDAVGIEKRRIRFIPDNLHLFIHPHKTEGALVLCSNIDNLDKAKKYCELSFAPNKELATAWDEATFGILTKGVNIKYLEELHQAFLRKDIAIWLGKTEDAGPLANAGLLIMIISRIHQPNLDTLQKADEDHIHLLQTAKDTGIEERLRKAGRTFFALSPRWIFEARKASSKYPVIFWLNPMEQHLNEAGWFSVEELDDWIAGKGPIVKRS